MRLAASDGEVPQLRSCAIFAALWIGLVPAIPATATDGAATPSPLHVDGKRLVNAAGREVELHGVSRSGTEFACIQGWGIFDGPHDAPSVTAIASWRANAVRVPLNEDCWRGASGTDPAYSGSAYRQAIVDYVSLLNANGLYAILDLHWSAPGSGPAIGLQPMPDLDHAPDFWSDVAGMFKGSGAVIFELYNEPWPDDQRDSAAAWTCWRDGGSCPGVPYAAAGMQTLVDAVRATGATNVIALPGVSYANALSQWSTYAPHDPLGNLVATWHVYDFNVCSAVSCYGSTAASIIGQVPVIATEIGTAGCDAAFLEALTSWFDAHHVGYLAWTWNTWGSDCQRLSLVSDYAGAPTLYGEIYRAHLAGLRQ